jgi:hypothetical protein
MAPSVAALCTRKSRRENSFRDPLIRPFTPLQHNSARMPWAQEMRKIWIPVESGAGIGSELAACAVARRIRSTGPRLC